MFSMRYGQNYYMLFLESFGLKGLISVFLRLYTKLYNHKSVH